jgi:hypothetical protein
MIKTKKIVLSCLCMLAAVQGEKETATPPNKFYAITKDEVKHLPGMAVDAYELECCRALGSAALDKFKEEGKVGQLQKPSSYIVGKVEGKLVFFKNTDSGLLQILEATDFDDLPAMLLTKEQFDRAKSLGDKALDEFDAEGKVGEIKNKLSDSKPYIFAKEIGKPLFFTPFDDGLVQI